jgi:hypothetical protein
MSGVNKMNYLDASIRGIKFQKKQIPNSKKIKYDASIGELNPKRLKSRQLWVFNVHFTALLSVNNLGCTILK